MAIQNILRWVLFSPRCQGAFTVKMHSCLVEKPKFTSKKVNRGGVYIPIQQVLLYQPGMRSGRIVMDISHHRR